MGRMTCTEPQCLYKGPLYLTFYTLLTISVSVFQPQFTEWNSTYLFKKYRWQVGQASHRCSPGLKSSANPRN